MKTVKRATALLIVLAVLFSLASCGNDKSPSVMTLGNTRISQNVYKYWICSYKATFLTTYSDMSDTDEFWDQILYDDVTAEQYVMTLIREYIKNGLVAEHLFDEFGLKLSDEDKETAENIVSDMCEYTGGGKNAFNAVLSEYGVNYNMLVDIYKSEFKSTYLYNYVFENNVLIVDDDVKQEYLENNYSRVRHIYINNAYDSENSYYDDDGNFVMVPLDEETQKIQDEKVETVKNLLASGADFDEVYDEYSEETAYPNGYYLSISTEDLPSELITNALSIDIGETSEFDTQYGYHAIKRLEMDEGAYDDDDNSDFFDDFTDSVYENTFAEYLQTYFDQIEVDEDAMAEISIRDVLPNYSFQY